MCVVDNENHRECAVLAVLEGEITVACAFRHVDKVHVTEVKKWHSYWARKPEQETVEQRAKLVSKTGKESINA